MIQRFIPLFTVAVRHSYYANRCEDFEFFALRSTVRALQGGRVQVRVLQGRLYALYETDLAGTPINSLAGRTLLFGLRLQNRFFSNFTSPVVHDPQLLPLYANRNDPLALAPPLGVVLASGTYLHVPQTPTRPLTLRLSDQSGAAVAAQTLSAGAASGTFDLRTLPAGSYRIDEVLGNGSVAVTRLFVSSELHGADLWGMLAVRVAADFYETPAAFTLDLMARQDPLKYFIVASNYTQLEFDQLNVTDNGFGEQGRAQLNFHRVAPESFTTDDPAPALLGEEQDRTVLFQSAEAVARHEHGFRGIQLHRNGDILVAHLPQPAADRHQSHFVVHLSKP